jgi:hypothetical protein
MANDDLEGTIRLLQKWLAMTSDEQQAMRQKAKQCFLEYFDIHQAAQNLVEVLNNEGS